MEGHPLRWWRLVEALLGCRPFPDIRASFPLALVVVQEGCNCLDMIFTCFWGEICTGLTKGFTRRCLFWIQLLCFTETDGIWIDFLSRYLSDTMQYFFYFFKGLVRHLGIKACCTGWWWRFLWNGMRGSEIPSIGEGMLCMHYLLWKWLE